MTHSVPVGKLSAREAWPEDGILEIIGNTFCHQCDLKGNNVLAPEQSIGQIKILT